LNLCLVAIVLLPVMYPAYSAGIRSLGAGIGVYSSFC